MRKPKPFSLSIEDFTISLFWIRSAATTFFSFYRYLLVRCPNFQNTLFSRFSNSEYIRYEILSIFCRFSWLWGKVFFLILSCILVLPCTLRFSPIAPNVWWYVKCRWLKHNLFRTNEVTIFEEFPLSCSPAFYVPCVVACGFFFSSLKTGQFVFCR